MRFKVVIKLLGALLILQSFFMLGCGCYDFQVVAEENSNAFSALGFSALTTFLLGIFFMIIGRGKLDRISRREGISIVGLGWISSAIVSALPFYLAYPLDGHTEPLLGISGAIFEATSGITATGSTNLQNIEVWPQAILLWRSVTQWLGGLGILVIFVAIMSYLGMGAKSLFRNESSFQTGEVSVSRIKDTANVILRIYIVLTLFCFLGLWGLGMTAYDAINHTFTTVSTGGFSTKAESIGFYSKWSNGWMIELWITFFMLICSVSFLVWVVLLKKRWARLWKEEEGKVFFVWCLSIAVIIFISTLSFDHEGDWLIILRRAWFNTISMASTTGFSTFDYTKWQPIAIFLLLFAMLLGGCSGSTTGGSKMSRVIVLIRTLGYEIVKAFRPNKVKRIQVNGNALSSSAQYQTIIFMTLFVFIFICSIGIITLLEVRNNIDLLSAFGMAIATLSNGGPGVGSVGPVNNFSHIEPITKLFLSFLMILGRLELFTVLVLFVPSLWRRY